MKNKIVIAVVVLAAFVIGATASDVYIHVKRTLPGELGVYCSNGGDPTVVGMEEKYLIVSCGAR